MKLCFRARTATKITNQYLEYPRLSPFIITASFIWPRSHCLHLPLIPPHHVILCDSLFQRVTP